ncbi:DUF5610 domain-containing protein [bacterium]|nr:DUF5610 domain-containing protein [bacterium]
MALSHVQFNTMRSRPVQEKNPVERGRDMPPDPESSPVDRLIETVQLGKQIEKTDVRAILTERLLTRVETETSPAAQKLFQAAGKADFEASAAASAADISPEATAGRIVDGITGYIFGAWKLRNPEMSETDFTKFRDLVMQGFEKGLQDAKDILTGLQVLDPELQESIGRTEELVRSQLQSFFDETLSAIREAAGSADEIAGRR